MLSFRFVNLPGNYSAGGAGGLRPPAGARGALASSLFFSCVAACGAKRAPELLISLL